MTMLLSNGAFATPLDNTVWKSDYTEGKITYTLVVKEANDAEIHEDPNRCILNAQGEVVGCTRMSVFMNGYKLTPAAIKGDRLTIAYNAFAVSDLNFGNDKKVPRYRFVTKLPVSSELNGKGSLLILDEEGEVVDSIPMFMQAE